MNSPLSSTYSLRPAARRPFLAYREQPLEPERPRVAMKVPLWWPTPETPAEAAHALATRIATANRRRRPASTVVDAFLRATLPAKFQKRSRPLALATLFRALPADSAVKAASPVLRALEELAGPAPQAQAAWMLARCLPRLPKSWRVGDDLAEVVRAALDVHHGADEAVACVDTLARFAGRAAAKNPAAPPLYSLRIQSAVVEWAHRNHEALSRRTEMLDVIASLQRHGLGLAAQALHHYPLTKTEASSAAATTKTPSRLESLAFAVAKNSLGGADRLAALPTMRYGCFELYDSLEARLAAPRRWSSNPLYNLPAFREVMLASQKRNAPPAGYLYSGWSRDRRVVRSTRQPTYTPLARAEH